MTETRKITPSMKAGSSDLFNQQPDSAGVQEAIDMMAEAMLIVMRHPDSVIPNDARVLAKQALIKAGRA